jgi:hypothetical protein
MTMIFCIVERVLTLIAEDLDLIIDFNPENDDDNVVIVNKYKKWTFHLHYGTV